ncbi:exopolyphosphatase/guanosine-5'-triphosphate,3'-diphosphate pyrophosphatase [Inhella inkyongensis]|uniref:Exopolyphosphatase/guanosine-5'-triphosphate, 3'-diphosphate pyrophosphatase n=1 Tax=Inhella inkyongensis TaxID=392593 RepID=A0A840S743_9BURK|nr:Ppx/GppA phosphatase family protein [Inhella inkyongensis]MBB5204279.1 exopolyphosphatase/guanosine-5'-triphosphate,3'-diphosphate pyrophosphatase [Inhella inkyongensis]
MLNPTRWGPDALAAIDLGSNSFRLEVARLRSGDYKTLAYWKEPIRLGAGLDANQDLTEAAMARALECLRRFGAELRGFAPERLRAVSTQTLREARNRDAFLVRAQEALGFPIEVISGREEARLIYAGVARLHESQRPRLVIDIGGRSTEIILGQGHQALKVESFQIGSVGLSVRFFADGRLTAEAFRAAQIAAAAELEEAVQLFARPHCQPAWLEVLGSSGTVGAVSQILEESGQTDGRITQDGLRWCIQACIQAGQVATLKLPGLREERRNVVAGGLAILYTLMVMFDIDAIEPARGALRQGLVFDMAERLRVHPQGLGDDPRAGAVLDVQRRFGVDTAQALRVRELARHLHQTLAPRAAREQRLELGWTADLHEIGQQVSHHDHHRHSHYLISHLDLAGFSQNQLRRMGLLVLGQRGGLRKLEAELREDSLLWQVLALRLALLCCHGRETPVRPPLKLKRREREITLTLDPAWVRAHPQTEYLLQQELLQWNKSGLLQLQSA